MIDEPRLERQAIIDWLERQRVAMPDVGGWQQVADGRAFAVSGLTKIDQVRAVLDSLKAAVNEGQSFDAWKMMVSDIGLPESRLDLIFRNFTQMAYMAGRFEAALQGDRYLMFSTVHDDRVTTPCRMRDGIIRHSTDPFWNKNCPPIHFFCRCTLISLDAEAAWLRSRNNSGLFQNEPEEPAMEGWGHSPHPIDPGIVDALRNALSDLPAELRAAADRYLRDGSDELRTAL